MLAIQLLNPGGILLTFLLLGLMTNAIYFQKIIADAAVPVVMYNLYRTFTSRPRIPGDRRLPGRAVSEKRFACRVM